MKKSFLLIAAAAAFTACNNSQSGYVINGTIDGAADGDTIYIANLNSRDAVPVDTAVIKGGKFTFKGTQDKPENTYIVYNMNDRETRKYANFYLENGVMTAYLGAESSYVKGTPSNNAFQAYKDEVADITKKIEEVEAKLEDESLTDTQREAINEQVESLMSDYNAIHERVIEANITNLVGVNILKSFYYEMDTEKLVAALNQIPAELAEGDTRLERIKEAAQKRLATAPGQKFTDFAMKTPDGKDINLSDYVGKGQIVLVDFWASWCGPCRVEMPNVKEAYAKFKDKGFEIVGVSLDRNEADWKKGIEDLGITWPQMSDVKYWDCEGAQLYGVQAIPATVLIDKDGTILKRNLRGAEIAKELEKLLG